MSEVFDYEKVFMGLSTGTSVKPEHLFKNDYRFRNLIETVKLQKGRLLDIGCGGGSLTENIKYYYPRVELYGCDVSHKAISLAKKYGSGNVKYSVNGNNFPYRSNYFDICLCLDVLEHVPKVDLFLSEVKRILKQKGLFYLVVPCEGQSFTLTSFFQRIKIGNSLTYKHLGHIHPEFTHQYVLYLLRNYKFTILDIKYSDHLLSQTVQFFMYFLAKEILENTLGEKRAEAYYDRSIIKSINNKKITDPIMIIRKSWLSISQIISFITKWETRLFNRMYFSASKLVVLAKNND